MHRCFAEMKRLKFAQYTPPFASANIGRKIARREMIRKQSEV